MKKISLIILSTLILTIGCSQEKYEMERYTNYVDPFIGTGGHGHTFPGATVPFGMIQLSPDNPSGGWDWTSGYHYSDSVLLGFSHTHLSGTGVGDLLDILIMPFYSDYPENTNNKYNHVYSIYSHENETAEPGYYALGFNNNNINAELTTTDRVGFHRYVFKKNNPKFLLDLGYAQNFDATENSRIEIYNDRTLVGFRKSKGWAKHQPTYFAIEFSEPFSYELYNAKIGKDGNSVEGKSAEAVLSFDKEENTAVLVKVALSSASIDGAKQNLEEEINHWDFDKVRRQASDKWENELSKIKIQSSKLNEKIIFYTAMYHSFIAPNLFSDANNEYYGADGSTQKAEGYDKYTLFSLWDTFRALHPLTTITKPEIVDDFVKSMLSFYDEYGLLPTWDLLSNETDVMIGYHAVPVIYDAYKKGLTTADPERIFEAMKTSAMQDNFGINYFKEYGYIPSELELEAVSKVLEYSYDDWCIAQMANDLGKEEDFKYFSNRADAYKLLFDDSVGFMRGKDKDGNWVKNFSPTHVEHRKTDYTEANAWQYTWHVLHDVPGLIELFGSEDKFINKLDELFVTSSEMEGDVSPDISGLIGQYAHGNEPCHHVTYLYAHTNQQWKAADKINEIRNIMYKAAPDGLSGNDDCGQMSSWYVFSAIGFYPLNPADGKFWFGTPQFEEVNLAVTNNRVFSVKTENFSEKNIYIKSAILNGKEIDRNFIEYDEIMNGGELIFVLTDKQN